jgi:hypothetical protein
VDGLFRLFGDGDGDRDVDHDDLDLMLGGFGTHRGDAGFQWSFDHDADGDVDGGDMAQFNRRRRSLLRMRIESRVPGTLARPLAWRRLTRSFASSARCHHLPIRWLPQPAYHRHPYDSVP